MNEKESKLTESIEDYIERIYLDNYISNHGVRITDLADAMNVSKASANDAVKRLKKLGYVEHEKYRHIYLTDKGREKGAQIYDKHQTLTRFFNEVLNVELEIAEKDACSVEHFISDQSYEQIKILVSKINN